MWVLPLPLWILMALYVGMDVYYPLAGIRPWLSSAGHLGGALFGLLFYRLHLDLPTVGPVLRTLRDLIQRTPSPKEVDRILDKISRQGIGDLTEGERATLKRAGRAKE
jgi:hypothetical protein